MLSAIPTTMRTILLIYNLQNINHGFLLGLGAHLCIISNDTSKFSMRVGSCWFLHVVCSLTTQLRDNQRRGGQGGSEINFAIPAEMLCREQFSSCGSGIGAGLEKSLWNTKEVEVLIFTFQSLKVMWLSRRDPFLYPSLSAKDIILSMSVWKLSL